MRTPATDPEPWQLDVVDDPAVPGWYLVPPDLDAQLQREWTDACVEDLRVLLSSEDPDDEPVAEHDVRALLAAALDLRASSPSVAIFQVWPVRLAATVQCHVTILASADLPNWSEVEGVSLFPVEGEHLGPGLQCAVRREDPDDGELLSLHYVFDDGDSALLLSLDESLAPLIGAALPGFVMLKDVLRMTRADGRQFAAVAPTGVAIDEEWALEDLS